MIYLDNFIMLLKICWIKRYKLIMTQFLTKYIKQSQLIWWKLLIECNIPEDDVCKFTQKRIFLCFFLFSVCYAFVRVCLYVPCDHLLSWLSFVVSNCEFVTVPLVSCARCGT